MTKREESTLLIARLVEMLAANGVTETEISSHEFVENPENDEQVQMFVDAVKWLEAEGVVRSSGGYSGTVAGEIVFGLVLTSLGFRLLDQKIAKDLTLGAAIARVNQEPRNLGPIGDFLGSILGGFTKSLGGG